MSALAEFVALVGVLMVSVQSVLVPADLASITILHGALWTPVVLGLLGLSGRLLKRTMRTRPAPAKRTSSTPARRPTRTSSTRASSHRPTHQAPRTSPRRRPADQAQARAAREPTAAEKPARRRQQEQAAAARAAKAVEREQIRAARAIAQEQAREQAAAKKAARAAAQEQRRRQQEQAAAERAAKAQEREQARAARAAVQEARPRKRKKRDSTSRAFGTDPNRVYEFRYRVVELDTLITSNTDSGAINPAYKQELQPRMRDRIASQRQIEQVARALVPESLLWDFHQLDKGAPIVGEDRMVESGNGRALALRRARADFPQQWANYQNKLRQNLASVGLGASDLAGMSHPVLVRERISEVDRVAFAREANAPPVLQMSTLETALVDSRRISDTMVLRLVVKEDQSIDLALRAASNRGFVREFMETLSENERAVLMRRDGTLNQQGIWRIKGALFTRVFPGEAGQRLAETFLEALDSTSKNFENSISATLPALARAESLIASGQRGADLSLAGDIGRALDVLARLKEQEMTVYDYVGQESMFERELTPFQERLLGHFDEIGRTPKQIRAFLNEYAGIVQEAPDPAQIGMFEQAGMSKDELLDRIIHKTRPQAKAA